MRKPTEVTFDQGGRFVCIKLTCTLTFKLLLDIFEEVTNSPLYSESMPRIWDVNEADLSSLDHETLVEVSKISSNRKEDVSHAKVAVISSQPLNESVLKLFQIHSRDLNQTTLEIFKTPEEAKVWVCSP